MRLSAVAPLADRLVDNVDLVLSGKHEVVRLAVVCLLAEGHLLVEDVPGTGKTTLARAVAASVGASWSRVQFTPDLLPSDITGVTIWNAGSQEFEFHPGPVFANVVIADEVNRASPKTQSALLEVMEERRVTVDGQPHRVPRPFLVMATQNPVEMDGTYRLPEAQLDRFLMRVEVGYPDVAAEADLLSRRSGGADPLTTIDAVLSVQELAGAITAVSTVDVSPELGRYIAEVSAATRLVPELRLGVSPRGSLALLRAARALAAMSGRSYVLVEDVQQLAVPVLAHRVLLTPQAEVSGRDAADLLRSVFASVAPPTAAGSLSRRRAH